jgi:hypothetical protein
MKTAKQWLEIWWSEQHDRRDFIRQIHDDAYNQAISDAAQMCDTIIATSVFPETISAVKYTKQSILSARAAAQPNESSSGTSD